MSQSSKEQNSACTICLKSEVSGTRLIPTRTTKKDNWIQCDCCKKRFHANCGGFTTAQYTKICKDNIWIKCLICCIQNVQLSEADDTHPSRISTAIEVARGRIL